MRRWQAIPVAAVVALLAATLLFSGLRPQVSAQAPPPMTISLDCDPTGGIPGGIQTACVFPSPGTTSATIDVIVTNNSGGPTSIGSLNFVVVGSNVGTLAPVNLNASPTQDANPGLDEETPAGAALGNLACSPPAPDNDLGGTPPSPLPGDSDPNTSESFLSCFTGSADGPTIANLASLRIAIVQYTVGVDGIASFVLRDAAISDNALGETGSCNPVTAVAATCNGATIQIGGSAATATPLPSATNTPPPTATCVGAACATATSLAFKSVTPTPSKTVPATAVPPTTAPAAPVAPAPPGGTAPGGAPGGRGAIRLPDTGSGTTSGAGWTMTLGLASAAIVAGSLAGGLWFGAATARARRREGGD